MSNTQETTQLGDFIIEKIGQGTMTNELSDADLVQIFELVGTFLNLKTISQYAKENNLSYNGVKNFREIITIFGVKFVKS